MKILSNAIAAILSIWHLYKNIPMDGFFWRIKAKSRILGAAAGLGHGQVHTKAADRACGEQAHNPQKNL